MTGLSNEQIVRLAQQLLDAANSAEAHRLLSTYPALISKTTFAQLTKMVGEKRQARDLWGMVAFITCLGLLRRCQQRKELDQALAMQPGWPLATQGPLYQLLTLPSNASADLRIQQAITAQNDVDPKNEADIYGLICYHLGLGHQAKADAGSNEALTQSMDHFKAAMQAWMQPGSLFGEKFLGRAQLNLGRLYLQLPQGDRSQNVERALELFKQALATFGPEASERGRGLVLHGSAYLERISGERLNNIEQAIHDYKEAYHLAARNEQVKQLEEIEHDLAVAYRLRLLGSRAENYEQAREWAEKALDRFDQYNNPRDWARTILELATIYGHRQYGDRAKNLEQAIHYAKQSLKIYEVITYPRQWALAQIALGNLYCDRVYGIPTTNYRQAITCFQAVLNHRDPISNPIGWAEAKNNLGTAYAGLSTVPRDNNYRQAVDCFQQALRIHKTEALPAKARRTASNWGNLAFRFGQWAEAQQAFQTALEAGERLYEVSSTEAGRRVEIAESTGLAANAAFCLLKLNPPVPDEALLQLEQGKTRLLSEALALGDADLASLPDAQREQILAIRRRVRELEAEMRLPLDTPARRNNRELAETLGQARAALKQLITNIRKDRPDFMPVGLDLPGLFALIPPSGALVAPLVTLQGSRVLVLPHGAKAVSKEYVIPLDDFAETNLRDLLIGSEQKPGWIRAYTTHQSKRARALERLASQVSPKETQTAHDLLQEANQEWQAAIEHLTSELWMELIEPVHSRLVDLGLAEGASVLLMPQGGLGLLPLHAAWREVDGQKRTFLDNYTVTYAPSGYALSVSQRRMQQEERHQSSLLAVINPTSDLTYTPLEGDAIATLFKPEHKQTLVESHATPDAVIEAATKHSYLHFSCHGFYNWKNAMQSGLVMAGGTPLILSEIISKLDLSSVRLVTLSACETGMTEFQQAPDEYIGLPAGFLQAGAPGVVSTLWAVNDLSTVFLMQRFYEFHLQNDLSPAEALRKAQLWLRDELTAEELIAYLEQERDKQWEKNWYLYGQLDQAMRYTQEKYEENPKARPFAHPYYWAAFTFNGV